MGSRPWSIIPPGFWKCINTLWPTCRHVIWRHRTRSILVQVMTCCLAVPSHYPNQCWLHHQSDLVALTWGQFYRKYPILICLLWVWILLVQKHGRISQGSMSESLRRKVAKNRQRRKLGSEMATSVILTLVVMNLFLETKIVHIFSIITKHGLDTGGGGHNR